MKKKYTPVELKGKILKTSILVIILLITILRSWHGTKLDSFANDEPFHIVAGSYYVQTGDYRINPEHPPLSKLWVGLWNKKHFKLRPFEVLDDKNDERKWLQKIMYFDNDDHLSQKNSRWAMYSFHFILGLMIGLLLWNIFGFQWALISLIWLALEPTIAAHQPIVLTDLPLSYTMVLTALTATKLCDQWKWKWAIAFGISIGMTMAVKHSALPGLAVIIVLVLITSTTSFFQKTKKNWLTKLPKIVLSGVLAMVVLWGTYGFKYHSSVNGKDTFNRSLELKISDLNLGAWKTISKIMSDTHLFPKAYVWGFADTVRAGIEGRGDDEHLFFGNVVEGRAPVLYFPAVILSKIPLALMLMVFISMGLLIKQLLKRYRLKTTSINKLQWLGLLFIMGFIVAHLTILAIGRTSYGGIRHALPVVAGFGVLVGGISLLKFPRNNQLWVIVPILLFGITMLMTLREKRIYEYHNEIVGGTKNAYKYFCNEGLYLGQRFYETKAFFDQPEINAKEPISAWSWYMREEWEAENLDFDSGGVKDIYDDSQEGIITGYYLMEMCNYIEWPNWDPSKITHLKTMKRIGNINIVKGDIEDLETWAHYMNGEILQHLRESDTPDWQLLIKRLERTTEIVTYNTTPFIILGNAYLRTQKKEKAIEAYQKALKNLEKSDPYEKTIENHITLVKNAIDLVKIENLRPATFE